ncbi:MAG: carbohydrate kinase family protein [Desulfobacterales bacterium]|nr:carbohydrate kinase family protein [Desulfobacterales bacterium]
MIGRSCLDYIAVVERFPDENQKAPLAFRLMEGGGQGGASSCCISRLGGEVTYVGRLGDDAEGRFCLKRLEDFGVNTDRVEMVKGGKTPVAYIFVTRATGRRTIIYEPSALPKIEIDDPLIELASRAGAILLDPETTHLGKNLDALRHGGAKIIYDCERWRPGVEEMMNAADYFIPSSDFLDSVELGLDQLTWDEKIIRLNEMVSGVLIVTRGARGAYYPWDGSSRRAPAVPVDAVDTIGAGDVFHGAFALAVSRGFDIHQAVRFSTTVASLSCMAYGGRSGVPDMERALAAAGIPISG